MFRPFSQPSSSSLRHCVYSSPRFHVPMTFHQPLHFIFVLLLLYTFALPVVHADTHDLTTDHATAQSEKTSSINGESLQQQEDVEEVEEKIGYVAYFKGQNLGNVQREISVSINGIVTTDVLLHNSSMLSFRIPTSIIKNQQLFIKSLVEISTTSKILARVPLSVLDNVITPIDLNEWKQQTTNQPPNDELDKDDTKLKGKIIKIMDEANEYLKLNEQYSNLKAITLLIQAHDLGNFTATTMLASIYLSSIPGIDRDVLKATNYLQMASDVGNPDAQALLGFLYASGYATPYIPLNIGAALLHWRFAADGGSNIAKMALAFRYFSGTDLQESCMNAAALYKQVAADVFRHLEPKYEGNSGSSRKRKEEKKNASKAHKVSTRVSEAYENNEVEGGEIEDGVDSEIYKEVNGDNDFVDAGGDDADADADADVDTDADADTDADDGLFMKEDIDQFITEEEEEVILNTEDTSIFYDEDDIDRLTSGILRPKGYNLPQAERKHLTEEGFQRVSGEKHEMVQYYRHNADRGEPHYQLLMGQLYYYGAADVPQDINRARKWFNQAIQSSDRVEAHSHLGFLDLQQGNNKSALYHLQIAADKDERLGLLGMGYLNLRGIGLNGRNISSAVKYFEKAARKEVPEALYNLGILYETGIGVPKSIKDSLGFFDTAARKYGHIRASYRVGDMYLSNGDGSDCSKGSSFMKIVAEQGIWGTLLTRALRAFEKHNYEDALFRYLLAAHCGLEEGQYNAAYLFEHNKVLNSPKLSIPLFHGTTTSKSNDRKFWMMINKEEEEDDDDDDDDEYDKFELKEERLVLVEQAMELYQMSVSQHSKEAMVRLGDLAYGEAGDYKRAALAYEQAIKTGKGNAEAMFNLGMMHARGFGMNPDKHMAKRYFDKAVETHPDAKIPAMIALLILKYSDVFESCDDFDFDDDGEEERLKGGGGDDDELFSKMPAFTEGGEDQQRGNFAVKVVLTLDILAVTILLVGLVAVVNARQRRLMQANDDDDLQPEAAEQDIDLDQQQQRNPEQEQDQAR